MSTLGWHDLLLGQRQQLQRQPRFPAAECLGLDSVHGEITEHPHCQ